MAKTLSAAPTWALPGPSNHPQHPAHYSQDSFQRRPRRRRRSPTRAATLAPSSAILSLLATIASSNLASASPTPPSFLCPSLLPSDTQDQPTHRHHSFPPPTSRPSSTSWRKSPRYVPDKFVSGTDGVWRRVPSYTLYGATMPSSSSCSISCQPSSTMSPVNNQIDDVAATTSSYDIQLPPGWTPEGESSTSKTTIIVALSISLALLISIFIVGCLFWRKGVRKRRKGADEEAKNKRGRRRRELTSRERKAVESEKEARILQKVWAKATARWKENARHAARQRRGKRTSTRLSQTQQLSLTPVDSRSLIAGAPLRQSPRRSRSPSLSEQATLSSQGSASDIEPIAAELAVEVTPSQPPAYHQSKPIPPIIVSTPDDTLQSPHSGLSTPHSLSRQASHTSLIPASQLSDPSHSDHPSAAHVATDDKAVLSRLAELASAPPLQENSPCLPEESHLAISVPLWEDEDLSEFSNETNLQSPSPNAFPPPPSKERLAAAERLEYSFSLQELDDMEPELGPSAPPFEEANPPASDVGNILPSAPLSEDQEFTDDHVFQNVLHQPSAPEWEPSDLDAHVQDEGEEGLGVDIRSALSNDEPATDPSSAANPADPIINVSPDANPSTRPLEVLASFSENACLPLYRP